MDKFIVVDNNSSKGVEVKNKLLSLKPLDVNIINGNDIKNIIELSSESVCILINYDEVNNVDEIYSELITNNSKQVICLYTENNYKELKSKILKKSMRIFKKDNKFEENVIKAINEIYEIKNRTKVDNFALSNDFYLYLTDLLHKIGLSSHLNGFEYILNGIALIYKNSSYKKKITKELYPTIATLSNNVTGSSVERCMRTCIEESFLRGSLTIIDEYFGYTIDSEKAKPTNSQFMITIAERIKLENDIKTKK